MTNKEPVHVHDWIRRMHDRGSPEAYAAFFLDFKSRPAYWQSNCREYMKQFKLFCTYEGLRWRCTGCSRLGDVWLARDPEQEHSYDLRVDVTDCSNWSAEI